ncbi:hypothetical protein QAD02_014127 [Eretmocerus hayati]|uniref:Uncharacterized protein n=1 Tax=Eretmocerus hayati TaxID=131215 RepID=A0ACC2P429_9HYME|nr:hypothetical protein QAD02_014127 [Eretmocerus hayati]
MSQQRMSVISSSRTTPTIDVCNQSRPASPFASNVIYSTSEPNTTRLSTSNDAQECGQNPNNLLNYDIILGSDTVEVIDNSLDLQNRVVGAQSELDRAQPDLETNPEENIVYTILTSTYAGRVMLDCYAHDNKPENKNKNKLFNRFSLCEKIIEYFNSQGIYRLTKDELDHIATCIIRLLLGQIEIIFFQASCVTKEGKKVSARGCLYESYRISRRIGRELGYIPKKNKNVILQVLDEPVPHDCSTLEDVLSDEIDEIDDDYKSLWNKHRKELRVFFNDKTIGEIIHKISASQLDNGYTLFFLEFGALYKNSDRLATEWPKTAKKILAYGKTKRSIDNFISKFPRPLTQVAEQNIAVLILPQLLINNRGKKGVNKEDKPLIFQTFAIHLKDIEELPIFRREITALYSTYSLKEQPFIGICGPIDGNKCFVDFFDHQYSCATLTEAMDICFRSFYGLAKYFGGWPLSVWEFFERHVYQIENPHIHSGVMNLLTALNDH